MTRSSCRVRDERRASHGVAYCRGPASVVGCFASLGMTAYERTCLGTARAVTSPRSAHLDRPAVLQMRARARDRERRLVVPRRDHEVAAEDSARSRRRPARAGGSPMPASPPDVGAALAHPARPVPILVDPLPHLGRRQRGLVGRVVEKEDVARERRGAGASGRREPTYSPAANSAIAAAAAASHGIRPAVSRPAINPRARRRSTAGVLQRTPAARAPRRGRARRSPPPATGRPVRSCSPPGKTRAQSAARP